IRRPEIHNALRVWIGQRAYQDGIDQAENRSGGADAESESEDCDGSEARRFAEHTEGEAQVLPAGFHEGFPAGRANLFLRSVEAAALEANGAKRLLAAYALFHLFFGGHFEEAV